MTAPPRAGRPVDALNQPPLLEGYDLFLENRPLAEALEREGAGWAADTASAFGRFLTGEPLEWGRQANESPPRLHTHDRFGNRIDEVEFHPAWHALLSTSVEHGLHALSWREPRAGAHVARAALFYLMAQVEAGHGCPISMTHAAVPALRAQPELAAEWEPLLTSLDYDPGLRPAAEKRGALCGMAMTERQGGSDVRANTTRARALGDGEYELTGHKWFCSAPMCDAFLVLAQAEGGLSCFLVPRALPDGTRNGPGIAARGGNPGAYFGPGAGPGPFHHYVFEFYALDTKLDLPANTTRDELLKAMEGHVIGKAAYTGRFHTPPQ